MAKIRLPTLEGRYGLLQQVGKSEDMLIGCRKAGYKSRDEFVLADEAGGELRFTNFIQIPRRNPRIPETSALQP